MREAELRVRGPGAPGARAAVEPDAEGRGADADRSPEAGAGTGEGSPRGCGARAVPGPGQAAHGGERGDLLRPPGPAGRGSRGCPFRGGRGKKGLRDALAQERAAEVTRLAAEAARALGCGDAGLEAAEQVIRAGLLRLGGVMLGDVLAADRGHRGHRVPCGNGHEAVFCGYRGKSFDTVLGLVAVTRAWYHCEACGHGLAPRDAELAIAGTSMSPGLAAMNVLAAAAGPFAGAARLLEELAGVRLTVKRVERAAESGGAALAPPSSRPAGWSRCRPRRCRTSSTPPSTAPASP